MKRNYIITSVKVNAKVKHYYYEKGVTPYQTETVPQEVLFHRIKAEHESIMENSNISRLETKVEEER